MEHVKSDIKILQAEVKETKADITQLKIETNEINTCLKLIHEDVLHIKEICTNRPVSCSLAFKSAEIIEKDFNDMEKRLETTRRTMYWAIGFIALAIGGNFTLSLFILERLMELIVK